ncbi:cytochrome c oxidase subunit 3 [Maioricimonas sp. JC845]|uniref:cytochrome c oxidase subunit 3 n=1 Tax=Maioricimonas sp. JC845 TaxID=3232138 RepID=UPI00345904EE
MTLVTGKPVPDRRTEGLTRQVRRAVGIALVLMSASAGAAFVAIRIAGSGLQGAFPVFPPPFVLSTLLLLFGSYAMHRAVSAVRRERQRPFRQWLLAALVTGGLFMTTQLVGLWMMLPRERSPAATSLGATPFVMVLTVLHALHFSVAVLIVVFVVSKALDHRYDHEYHWGVTFAAWFWHFLGIVWLGILAVFAIIW